MINRVSRIVLAACVIVAFASVGATADDQGRFSLGTISEQHTFITPTGDPLWILGVNHIGDTREERKPGETDDIYQARVNAAKNLENWAYNCAGGDCSGPIQSELPYFVTVGLTETAHWMPQYRFRFEDVFSEQYAERIEAAVQKACRQHRDNSNLVGYFWTDTPRWDLNLTRNRRGSDWPTFIRSLPADSPGKHAYVRFLRTYFDGSIDKLNQAFRSQVESFDELAQESLRGLELIRPTVRQCDEAFLGIIADRIYSVAADSFRRHDPHALLLGEKFKSHDHPKAVLDAAVKYMDVISIQDGPEFGPFPGQGRHESSFDQEYFDELHHDTGKPILIVDHAMSWKTPGRPTTLWYQCPTQAEAARMYDKYLMAAAGRPYILGYCRCQYVSTFRADRGLLKQGLLDENGKPYPEIVDRFSKTNRKALAMRHE